MAFHYTAISNCFNCCHLLVRPIGIYILMMIGMSTVTIVFGITTYFSEKKKYNKDVEKREKDYKAYLDNKSKEINKAIKAQRFSLNYHYPTVAEIKDIVETKAPRIYEKHRIITISYIIS